MEQTTRLNDGLSEPTPRPRWIAGPGEENLHFGPGQPVLYVNDRIGYAIEQPEMIAQLKAGGLDGLLDIVQGGLDAGVQLVNLQLMRYELDEAKLLPQLLEAVVTNTASAISLDTRNPELLETCLRLYGRKKTLCNVVNGEWENLRQMLPILAKYDCVLGTALVDEKGIPMTVSERVRVARRIVETAQEYGIDRHDVLIDAVCMPAGAVPGSVSLTLESMRAIREELDVPLLLGVSNVGHMMPKPGILETIYCILTAGYGLNVAMIDPAMPAFPWMKTVLDFYLGADPYAGQFLRLYREETKLSDKK